MLGGKVLMIGLSFVERVKADNLSDNRSFKNCGLIYLIDVGLGNAMLPSVGVEDH